MTLSNDDENNMETNERMPTEQVQNVLRNFMQNVAATWQKEMPAMKARRNDPAFMNEYGEEVKLINGVVWKGTLVGGLMALSSSLLLRKLNKGPFVRVIGALSVFSISWASTVFSLTVDAAPKLATCKRSVLLDTVCPVFEKDLRPYFSQGFLEDKTIVKKKQQFLELNRMCTIYRKRREEEGGSESRPPKVELLALEGDKEQDSSAEDELRREKEERMRRARGGGERYNHPHRGGGGGGEKAASSPTPHSSGSSHSSTASTDGWEDWDEMDKQDSSKSHQLDNEEEL